MLLTLAICTWNRAAQLGRALDRLAAVEPPDGGWEVLVVDNGSTDHTAQVVAAVAGRLPVRRVVEPTLGLSRARNAAVDQAKGDYIAWTDDDVLLDRGWLRAYQRAIRCWPEAAVFGGPIRVHFDVAPPSWLIAVWAEVKEAYAVRDFGESPLPLHAEHRLPYGANYVVRAREQRRHPYDPALGRRGREGALGEETDVLRAILAEGGSGRWVPEAGVTHCLGAERLSVRYLRRYFELAGRTTRAEPAGRFLLARCLRAECLYRLRRLRSDPARWIAPLIEASRLQGQRTRLRMKLI